MAANGAVVAGRATYESAGHWGDKSPWGLPVFVVTHRPEEQPAGDEFIFVGSVTEAVERAKHAAADKQAHVLGGADVIRQALAARPADGLSIIVAPVVMGGGDQRGALGPRGFRARVRASSRDLQEDARLRRLAKDATRDLAESDDDL